MKPTRHFKVVGGKDSGDGTPPNQSVIDHLEEALELAKRGIMQEVVVIGVTADNVMVNGWSDTKSVFRMLGAIDQTKTDYKVREIAQHRPEYHD